MMKHIKFFFLLMFAASLFVSCDEENEVVTYTGYVIHSDTREPFSNLEVSVTDGQHINKIEHTDAAGFFSILVRFNEINSSYYLLIGDISCNQVKREFKGFGQSVVDLGTIEVEGPKVPTVTTASVSAITAGSASCGGNVTDDGRAEVSARGVCWSKAEYPTLSDAHTTNGNGKGEFQSQLTNLEAGVKYYVRAYATNRLGTSYGNQVSFETTTGLPVVSTDSVGSIRSSSAICYANVTSNGGYKLIEKGVCWSPNTSTPALDNPHTTEAGTTGAFSSMMINLQANTTYYVRAYATNENGTTYGDCIQFKTGNGMPIVQTLDPGEVTSNSILAIGNVLDDEGSPITERGIVYSTLPYPTIGNGNKVESGSGTGYFSATITNVLPDKNTYYIRAYATNANGTGYGDQVELTPNGYADYLNLKTMVYGGYTYKIKPLGPMAWDKGNEACANMVHGGYDDWFMPNTGEVEAILRAYEVWNVTSEAKNPLLINNNDYIWTSTPYNSSYYNFYYLYRYNTYSNYYWKLVDSGSSDAYYTNTHEVIAVRKY